MKLKREHVILALVIIALSAYLFLRHQERTGYELPKLPKMSTPEVSRIKIERPAGTLMLQRRDEKWFFDPEGYLADAGKVNEILDSLENLTLTALVS
ncbi:MAG: hypothetical protein JRJ29_08400, partial [Deltaproteobacteria bacterium]|nr:hypothetical protein [Deltaproteobacteria bacterium]